jgi:hypothetical protein
MTTNIENNRSVVNLKDEVYSRVKTHCQKNGYKISAFVEQSVEALMLIQEKELRCRCLVFSGPIKDLRLLDDDPKVQINGWGGNGLQHEKNYHELYRHSHFKSDDLLLSYIVDYVKKAYPNIKITELDYQSFKEVGV